MLLGTNDGSGLQTSLVAAKANLAVSKLAGFNAVTVRVVWSPGDTSPDAAVLERLRNYARAARLLGMTAYFSVASAAGRTAPTDTESRTKFAQFAATIARQLPYLNKVIIGNEPNLNRFWAPQFDLSGGDAAAKTYFQALALAYDKLKAVSKNVIVIGGAVSPRGHDDPSGSSLSHSPTVFIQDLGGAYRASGRNKPIMDWFAFHPYGANSSEPPATRHETTTAISIGDYGKLVKVLGQAFDGTKQLGSKIPILYDEYGIESAIPANKTRYYTGDEPASTKPLTPTLQGERYRDAIALTFCAPTVKAMLLFHTFDEIPRDGWQSGLYYVDKTPKPSLRIVRQAFQEVRRGVIARCAGMRLKVNAKVSFPTPRQAATAAKRGSAIQFHISCNLDCQYTSGVINLSNSKSILAALGEAKGGKSKNVKLPARALPKGRYRVVVSLVASVNPGPASRKASLPFVVP
jgi:hypothetical protein